MVALLLALALAAPAAVTGVVKDPTGAVVTGASVIVKPSSGGERVGTTGPDGRFNIDMPVDGDVTVVVRSGGFAEKSQRVVSGERGVEIEKSLGLALEYHESPRGALARLQMRRGEIERARASLEELNAEAVARGDEGTSGQMDDGHGRYCLLFGRPLRKPRG